MFVRRFGKKTAIKIDGLRRIFKFNEILIDNQFNIVFVGTDYGLLVLKIIKSETFPNKLSE